MDRAREPIAGCEAEWTVWAMQSLYMQDYKIGQLKKQQEGQYGTGILTWSTTSFIVLFAWEQQHGKKS